MAAKSLAELVNDGMSGPDSDGDLGQEDYDQGMQDATQAIIDAAKKGDAAGVDAALRNWHEMAHKNWGDYPGAESTGPSPEGSGKHMAIIIGGPHGGS